MSKEELTEEAILADIKVSIDKSIELLDAAEKGLEMNGEFERNTKLGLAHIERLGALNTTLTILKDSK
jgi:hypothetical protein